MAMGLGKLVDKPKFALSLTPGTTPPCQLAAVPNAPPDALPQDRSTAKHCDAPSDSPAVIRQLRIRFGRLVRREVEDNLFMSASIFQFRIQAAWGTNHPKKNGAALRLIGPA